MSTEVAGPDGSALSEGLGPLPDTAYVLAREGNGYEPEYLLSEAGYSDDHMRAYAAAAVAAERERCAKLCETWMEAAERDSGPEAAGWLHQMAQHMRGLGPNVRAKQEPTHDQA